MGRPSRGRRVLGATLLGASVALVVWATLLPGHETAPELIPMRWCLQCGELWLADAIANVVLFVPLGVALVLLGVSWGWAVLVGVACTVSIETLQSMGVPPFRSPAVADLLSNSVGTVIGALLMRWARVLWWPAPWVARWLWIGALGVSAGVLYATAMASAPIPLAEAMAPNVTTVSPYEHTPNQGWFAGRNDSARVGPLVVRRGYSGPIIVQNTAALDTLRIASYFRGHDARGGGVPVLFVHRPNVTWPELQVRVQRDGVTASVARRAFVWGVRLPSAALRGVLAGRSRDDARPVAVDVQARRDTLIVRAAVDGGAPQEARVAYTPLLGWAFVQPVIGLGDRAAPVVAVLWLALLIGPAMWWAARDRWRLAPVVVAVGVGGVLWCLPALTGAAPIAGRDWGVIAGLLLVGWAAARLGARTGWGSTEDIAV